jgi:ABC-2 type transport system ATP-binding protein
MESIIEVSSLSKRFGEKIVLDNISFSIEKGAVFGIIGKSGCGKTTLLNMLIGFLQPNLGEIKIEGKTYSKHSMHLREKIGFAAQEASFYKKLSVQENIKYFGRLHGLNKEEINRRTEILLKEFGLVDAVNVMGGQLSIGMQKRLDIACALINDPEVLILDEPTANLDPMLRKNILDLIKKINLDGTTIIISSHLLDDIKTLCDNVLVIKDKRIAAIDNPENIENQYSTNMVKILSEKQSYDNLISNLMNANLITNHDFSEQGHLIVHTKDIKNTLKTINQYFSSAKDSLVNIEVINPSMEDAFENLTNG